LRIRRVVDLSYHLSPEQEQRRLRLTPIRTLATDFVNECSFEAHAQIGTHVEGPFRCIQEGRTVDELPLDRFIGEAAVVRLNPKLLQEREIDSEHLVAAGSHVIRGDIVLLCTGYDDRFPAEGLQGDEYKSMSPYLTEDAVDWLIDRKIKALGIDFWSIEPFPIDPEIGEARHRMLFRHEIPLVQGLVNLLELEKARVLFAALPLPIEGLDSSPVRATAVEFL
jgi:kynurenine formamidase